jgi:hypothetical protein
MAKKKSMIQQMREHNLKNSLAARVEQKLGEIRENAPIVQEPVPTCPECGGSMGIHPIIFEKWDEKQHAIYRKCSRG